MRANMLVEPGSAASLYADDLRSVLEQEHSWEWPTAATASPPPAISLVFADTVAAARRLAAETSSAVIFVGIAGEGFGQPGSKPSVGSVPELLEQTRAVGLVPAPALPSWRSKTPTFIGQKDLTEGVGATCFKAVQSESYCLWIDVPGADLPEFLTLLLRAMSR
jgi:hypothetical protein